MLSDLFFPTGRVDATLEDYVSAMSDDNSLFNDIPGASSLPLMVKRFLSQAKHRTIFDNVDLSAWQACSNQLWAQWDIDIGSVSDSFWRVGVQMAEQDSVV